MKKIIINYHPSNYDVFLFGRGDLEEFKVCVLDLSLNECIEHIKGLMINHDLISAEIINPITNEVLVDLVME